MKPYLERINSMKFKLNSKIFKEKGYKNSIYLKNINYIFNFLTYKSLINKNFIKITSYKKFNGMYLVTVNFSKGIKLMLNTISSLSKKLGEVFVKVPFLFFSNNISYSSAKNISKKI
jgi:hypothetical protein